MKLVIERLNTYELQAGFQALDWILNGDEVYSSMILIDTQRARTEVGRRCY